MDRLIWSNSNRVAVTGNLTFDPTLTWHENESGSLARCTFRIAENSRVRDPQTGEWVDGETTFFGVTCFRQLAEHVAASITRGMRVVVHGRLEETTKLDEEGNTKTYYNIIADDVAVSLRYATAAVTKVARSGGEGEPVDQIAQPVKASKTTKPVKPAPKPQLQVVENEEEPEAEVVATVSARTAKARVVDDDDDDDLLF